MPKVDLSGCKQCDHFTTDNECEIYGEITPTNTCAASEARSVARDRRLHTRIDELVETINKLGRGVRREALRHVRFK